MSAAERYEAYIVDFFISGIYSSSPSKQADRCMKSIAKVSTKKVRSGKAETSSVLAVLRISLLTPVLLLETTG